MRVAAIISNLAQICIVFAMFLFIGLSLGGWALLALFVLLLIAVVNLMIILFYPAIFEGDQAGEAEEKSALVKRRDFRVLYAERLRPDLITGKRAFTVLDLSENGLRIVVNRNDRLQKHFKGHIALLSGKKLVLKLTLLRRQGNEAALATKSPIDYKVLNDEIQLAQNDDEPSNAG